MSTHELLAACEAAGWRFRRPSTNVVTATWASHHVYLSNVAGVDDATIKAASDQHGTLLHITRVVPPSAAGGNYETTAKPLFQAAVLTYSAVSDAQKAQKVFDGAPALAGGLSSRPLVARLSQLEEAVTSTLPREPPPPGPPAHRDAAETCIPGLSLLLDFVTEDEEAALLRHIDRPDAAWEQLSRRRVLHEGYKFDYHTRGADTSHPLGEFGAPVAAVLERIHAVPQAARVRLCQSLREMWTATHTHVCTLSGRSIRPAHCE